MSKDESSSDASRLSQKSADLLTGHMTSYSSGSSNNLNTSNADLDEFLVNTTAIRNYYDYVEYKMSSGLFILYQQPINAQSDGAKANANGAANGEVNKIPSRVPTINKMTTLTTGNFQGYRLHGRLERCVMYFDTDLQCYEIVVNKEDQEPLDQLEWDKSKLIESISVVSLLRNGSVEHPSKNQQLALNLETVESEELLETIRDSAVTIQPRPMGESITVIFDSPNAAVLFLAHLEVEKKKFIYKVSNVVLVTKQIYLNMYNDARPIECGLENFDWYSDYKNREKVLEYKYKLIQQADNNGTWL